MNKSVRFWGAQSRYVSGSIKDTFSQIYYMPFLHNSPKANHVIKSFSWFFIALTIEFELSIEACDVITRCSNRRLLQRDNRLTLFKLAVPQYTIHVAKLKPVGLKCRQLKK